MDSSLSIESASRHALDIAVAPAIFSADPQRTVVDLFVAAGQAGRVLSAHLWIHDAATSTYRQVSWHGSHRTVTEPISDGSAPFARAEADRRSVLEQLRSGDHLGHEADGAAEWRFVIPLLLETGRGAAAVDFEGSAPDPEVLGHIALAHGTRLAAALSVHVARHEAASAAALLRATRALARIVDPDAAAHELLDRAMSLANAQTGSVMLRAENDERMRIVASKGLPAHVVEHASASEGEGVAGWVLATGRPTIIEDRDTTTPAGQRHGVRCALCVPICDEDGVIGVLNVGCRAYPGRAVGALLDTLQGLAEMGAMAIRGAQASVTTRRLYFETVQSLVAALESKDPFAHGATDRVVAITGALGRAMSLSEADAEALRIASLLHDIGMRAAGDVVAVSNRPLSTVEHTLLKMHPVIAADILRQAPALERVVPIVYHHHERYDGSGYITGLSGDGIPLGARILSVADAFVAMTSDRPYRRAMTHEEAYAELRAHSGSQFDPDVVAAFASLDLQDAE